MAAAGKIIDLILLLVLVYFLIAGPNLWGECNFNQPNCGTGQYCSLDNSCQAFPQQEKVEEVQKTEQEQMIALPLFLSLLMVSGAIWYRKK